MRTLKLIDADSSFYTFVNKKGEQRIFFNKEIITLLRELAKKNSPHCRWGLIAKRGKAWGEIVVRSAEGGYQDLDSNDLWELLRLDYGDVFKDQELVMYQEKQGELSINLHGINKRNTNVLLVSHNERLLSLAESLSWKVVRSYRRDGELENVGLDSLDNDDDLGEGRSVKVYVGLDYALLNVLRTRSMKKTILNRTVMDELVRIKVLYPHAVFYMMVDRCKTSAESSLKQPMSVAAVKKELLEEKGIEFEAVIFTSHQLEEKVVRTSKKGVILRNQEDYRDTFIVCLDASFLELKRLKESVFKQFISNNTKFLLLQVHQEGDINEGVRSQVWTTLTPPAAAQPVTSAQNGLFAETNGGDSVNGDERPPLKRRRFAAR